METNPILELAEEDIQKEAYLLYQSSGCVPGHDLENWLAAKAKLSSRPSERVEKEKNASAPTVHFPLSSNMSRAPFGSNHPFINPS